MVTAPFALSGQQGGRFDGAAIGMNLDNTWSPWALTSDLDPRVTRSPYLPKIQFRWRRLNEDGKSYTCEVQFRNGGKVVRDFAYAVSYDTAQGALKSRQEATGKRLGVVGLAETVVVPNCYTVAPLVTVDAQSKSEGIGSWAAPFTYVDEHFNGQRCSIANNFTVTGPRLTFRQEFSCNGDIGHFVSVEEMPLSAIIAGRPVDYGVYWALRLRCASKTTCINSTIDGTPGDPSSFSTLVFPSEAAAMAAAEQLRTMAN
jgi:hypothetical protein